jgi:Carboxypeptidase regulatory-like domain
MSLNFNRPLRTAGTFVVFALAMTLLLSPTLLLAQADVGNGNIVGAVSDPSGAVVSGAKVTITEKSKGVSITRTTDSKGSYTSGALIPGVYVVRVEAAGFKSTELTVTVQVDNTASGNAKLEVGQTSQVVEVEASSVSVNTEQATVQGVITENQIANLPVNGRNFLDLAQLEPGVQIQDGQNFDPTKAGYSSISFGGRFGRTARIEVDGVDVSDETVGTTTTDIPSSAIQEFQISQSSLDMSTELTSSGAVNVTTKSGTNGFHGDAFGAFRDSVFSAALPTPPGFTAPYQRSQYGGDVGGPILKNKLFFFADGERTIQHTAVPVPISAPFSAYSGTFQDGFHEGNLLGRLDYQVTKNVRAFFRFSDFQNLLGATFGYGYSVYDNKNITRNFVGGVDFNTGTFSHAIRFSYLKFQNQIVDATTGSTTLPFANIHAELFMGSSGLVAGPNLLSPQSTPQSDHQIKYDGSKIIGAHVIRYGVSYNHIQGGGFASFFKNGPQVASNVDSGEIAAAATGPFPGGAGNPLNYPDDFVLLSNGLGYSTTKAALGFPAGGLGPDNRISFYGGDSWKIKPNFTLTYGLRYARDTGRTDSQYPVIPGLNNLIPGDPNLGAQVNQPNNNWAPQLGIAWDPWKDGKTSIRGGIGLFYENAIWNNVLFDGPTREATGAFLQFFPACSAAGSPAPLQTVNGQINLPGSASALGVCGPPGSTSFPLIGNALPAITALAAQYQAGNPLNLQAPNPGYVQPGLAGCVPGGSGCFFPTGNSMFNPDYKSPRSVQMNFGIQRELRRGMVFSADFARNVQTHYLLGIDQNDTGSINYFNLAGANAAINATNSSFGCPAGAAGVGCAIAAGASMSDYAGNGLGATGDFGGASCFAAVGHACAFGGKNPYAPAIGMLSPVGRSVYDGLQMKWTDNVKSPFKGSTGLNFTASYSLSRFDNTGGGVRAGSPVTASSGDQDFIVPALDNNNVNQYFGQSTLDRTHQISFGGYLDVRYGFQIGVIGHFYSPLSTTLTVPNTGSGPGEIFRTDFTGDGTTQDPMPGTHVGNFDRGINAGNINAAIANYNSVVAGQPTPAGQVLIQNGLMTAQQLVALGGVAPTVPLAPPDQVNEAWLRTMDMTLAWTYTIKERLTIKPSVGFFNVFNFANFDLPESMMSGLLTGATGSINGTNYAGAFVNRVGVGTGVYSLGSPRTIEFALKLTF